MSSLVISLSMESSNDDIHKATSSNGSSYSPLSPRKQEQTGCDEHLAVSSPVLHMTTCNGIYSKRVALGMCDGESFICQVPDCRRSFKSLKALCGHQKAHGNKIPTSEEEKAVKKKKKNHKRKHYESLGERASGLPYDSNSTDSCSDFDIDEMDDMSEESKMRLSLLLRAIDECPGTPGYSPVKKSKIARRMAKVLASPVGKQLLYSTNLATNDNEDGVKFQGRVLIPMDGFNTQVQSESDLCMKSNIPTMTSPMTPATYCIACSKHSVNTTLNGVCSCGSPLSPPISVNSMKDALCSHRTKSKASINDAASYVVASVDVIDVLQHISDHLETTSECSLPNYAGPGPAPKFRPSDLLRGLTASLIHADLSLTDRIMLYSLKQSSLSCIPITPYLMGMSPFSTPASFVSSNYMIERPLTLRGKLNLSEEATNDSDIDQRLCVDMSSSKPPESHTECFSSAVSHHATSTEKL